MEHSKKMYTFSSQTQTYQNGAMLPHRKGRTGKAKNPRFRSYGEFLSQKKNRSKISFNIMVAAPGIQDSQE